MCFCFCSSTSSRLTSIVLRTVMVNESWHSLKKKGSMRFDVYILISNSSLYWFSCLMIIVCVCCVVYECSCRCGPDYFSSLLRGQVIDSDVIDLHKLVAGDEPAICRTTWTHKMSLCCHAWACSIGLHSCCDRDWWQTVACILVISFHLTLMHNFSHSSPNLPTAERTAA